MALEKDYEVVERLGEGAFGKVYKAKHRNSGDVVAVKQIKLGAKSWDEALKATELQALRTLRHGSIVRLRELLRSQHDGSLYYVFEFIGSDLFVLMRSNPQGLEESRAAKLTNQLFSGLAHIHTNNFFHRDIKPENILFDEATETIRIADFGEARSVRARPPFTDYVGTRWYRAPECLLRDRTYSSPVDVWASGLVFAELLRGSCLFCGTSSIDQLYKIFTVLGQPLSDWPEFSRLAEAIRFKAVSTGCGLHRVLPATVSPQAQALIADILNLNPRRRPLARKCLENPYFSKLPPLDLDRAEMQRDASRSLGSTARLEAPSPRLYSSGPSPRVDEAAEKPPPSTGQSQPRTPEDREPNLSVTHDDLDLDAELDRILSVTSPLGPTAGTSAAAQADPAPSLGGPIGSGISGGIGHLASEDPVEGSLTLALNSAEAFAFTPEVRDPSRPSSAASGRGSDRSRPALASEQRPERSDRPPSPCGGSVEALLEDLCKDLGVGEDPLLEAVGDPPGKSGPPAAAGALRNDVKADLGLTGASAAVDRSGSKDSQSTTGRLLAGAGSFSSLPPLPGGAASELGGYPGPAAEHWASELGGLGGYASPTLPISRQGSAASCGPAADEASRDPRPWTEEEAGQLRRIVKKVTRRGSWEKEALWIEVANELGGGRNPRECKAKYTRDYKARKAEQAKDTPQGQSAGHHSRELSPQAA